jgi:outer membrane murein-binding lipoprotein Lpp
MSHPAVRSPRRGLVRTVFATLAALLGGLVLAGCAQAVPFDPAADASDPDCAAVVVRLPDTVAGLAERETNAQGTGAWGQPA